MKLQEISPFARFVRYISMEKETEFPPYIPRDARLFCVTQGLGIIQVEEEVINLEKGQVLYINSGVKYRHMPCEVTYLAVNFDFTDSFSYLEAPIHNINPIKHQSYNVLESITFDDAVCFDSYCIFSNCHHILNLLIKLENEFIKKLPFHRAETSALLKSVLSQLARNAENSDTGNKRFNVEEIVSYIQKHYREPLTNEGLSKIFHYHPNYLTSEFKKRMGSPIHKYILETRILKASSMLESGYNNLNEVALLCGFSDMNYFSRYFKKMLGVSPSRFAKSRKK